MNRLAEASTAYTVLVGLACALCCVRTTPRPRVLDLALVVVGIASVGVAVTGLLALVRGARPAELSTHLGYLAVTPLLLPVTAGMVRGDRGRWGSAAFATGCLVLAVVTVRLIATSRA